MLEINNYDDINLFNLRHYPLYYFFSAFANGRQGCNAVSKCMVFNGTAKLSLAT